MHQQVTVLIAKHVALLDDEAMRGMRSAADEKRAEALAAKTDSPESLVRVSLLAQKEARLPAPTRQPPQSLANEKAKVTSPALLSFPQTCCAYRCLPLV